jgi:hypothetical protein
MVPELMSMVGLIATDSYKTDPVFAGSPLGRPMHLATPIESETGSTFDQSMYLSNA